MKYTRVHRDGREFNEELKTPKHITAQDVQDILDGWNKTCENEGYDFRYYINEGTSVSS